MLVQKKMVLPQKIARDGKFTGRKYRGTTKNNRHKGVWEELCALEEETRKK